MREKSASNPSERFGDSWKLTAWSKDNQPSGESKSRGWLKNKRARELYRFALGLDFVGNDLVRDECAKFFGVPAEELTNEAMIMFKNIHQALQGDLQAAQMLMDRAYGKPKEIIEAHVNNNPQFIVETTAIGSDNVSAPPIATSEDEIGAAGGQAEGVQ